MDRLVQRNVLAMSGRAVEASGDVDVLLLDKTGTITIGNREAAEFIPADGVSRSASWPRPPRWPRWPTRPPRAARSSCWPRSASACASGSRGRAGSTFVAFTAETRMSGVNFNGTTIRKGAAEPSRRS